MEAITVGIAIGATAVVLAKNGRARAKAAIGWAARHAGWLAARVRSDIAAANRVAREEFEHARRGEPGPAVDVVVPSERVTQGNGAARSD
jgi:hypothetical protein